MRSDPDKYVDGGNQLQQEGPPHNVEEMTEHERYESLCREAWPIVSTATATVGSV